MRELSYAIIGKGKTGNHVVDLLKAKKCEVFDSTHKPTVERLKKHDVAIIFLPGAAFTDLIPTLVDAKIPVVSGATGWDGRDKLSSELKKNNLTWIWGSNFALGMNFVKAALEQLGNAQKLANAHFSIHEIHHIMKVDAPSGTALSWKEWIGAKDVEITSERTGDVIGIHEAKISLPYEEITLTHNALDRKIFASGAIWAAERLASGALSENGLLTFDQVVKKELL